MEKIILLVVLAFHCVSAHKIYEDECPAVEPMPDFDITKFLGLWYQVQPDYDSDSQNVQDIPTCEFYDITYSHQRNTYVVNTMFELYAQRKGDTQYKFESISTNYLTALNENHPAKMRFTPTSGAHVLESTVTIFMTDYESYAIISNCDKESNNTELQFTQHATLWSRTRNLDDYFIEKLYGSSGSFDFDPYDLFSVSKTGCIEGAKRLIRVNLDNAEIVP